MKVIKVDNFDRENRSDVVVCENVNSFYAPLIAKLLNSKLSGNNAPDFYKAVKDDYKLFIYEV